MRSAVVALVMALAAAGCAGEDPVPITELHVNGTMIAVPDCHERGSLEVEETPDEVRLTFSAGPHLGGGCCNYRFAELGAPPGDRSFVDTATGEVLTPADETCEPELLGDG